MHMYRFTTLRIMYLIIYLTLLDPEQGHKSTIITFIVHNIGFALQQV